ncbi:hypothetical protein [Neorhizobium petrolearium]|uniref:DUF1488 family protein n=2 Tax=Neorhizobium TaxID=1525371 RepID=A0ABY8LXS7_9HYPH|nr:hypothetical protein [Neorhizobium petrolearium]MCC2611001.1 hypothetical protein [Neorhizobium petrolearium]WGI66221.1 hypothetical protein QEO92_14210 [Neorhizobium petrolearium]
MPLKLKSGFLTSSGDEGRLLMDSGTGDEVVVVSYNALEAIADPPRADEFRLQQYIEAFSQIASNKFDEKQFGRAGHIRVTSEDVRNWRVSA